MSIPFHPIADVQAFHRAADVPSPTTPAVPSPDRVELRRRLIKEEVGETLTALKHGDLVELADGLADSIVVLIGTALEYGIDRQPVWDEVHRTNMAKFPECSNPHCHDGRVYVYSNEASTKDCKQCQGRGTQLIQRDDGKILKPPDWRPPDIRAVLEDQGWSA